MQHMSDGGNLSTGETADTIALLADDPIVSVGSFSERTNDLSNGLIWPKDG
ncbi:hypothetical protein MPL3365_140099 [Mesorhizobium plurifarium]|uniref:Uncharacterized protein n=1 Tax=Mesorhizobium plurifarium TaxID=69974 RepID=A0A090G481_MESPL|nr:hypothetical protein MPL3365_140099 [Mesorhizobium plurifarium]